MALVVLDSSVVIAHLDARDVHHEVVVGALAEHRGDDLRLPASAYAEVLVGAIREGRVERAREDIEALLVQIESIGTAIADAAAALRAEHRALRLPDALVLATGEALAADAVLTADARWAALTPRVRVIA